MKCKLEVYGEPRPSLYRFDSKEAMESFWAEHDGTMWKRYKVAGRKGGQWSVAEVQE